MFLVSPSMAATYEGRVLEKGSNRGLPGVKVTSVGQLAETVTDAKGRFRLDASDDEITGGVPREPAYLTYTKQGYYPKSKAYAEPNTKIKEYLTKDVSGEVFDQSRLLEYRFTLTEPEQSLMIKDALKEQYVRASLKVNGEAYSQVGLRYKGSPYSLKKCFDVSGKIQPVINWCKKVSLKVDFRNAKKYGYFYGLKRLDLLRLRPGDVFSNKLSYELFQQFGVEAPRTAFAKVYINDEYDGLYLATEIIDRQFARHHFPSSPDGSIYKEVWPDGRSRREYLAALKSKAALGDLAGDNMIRFSEAVIASASQTFEANMEGIFDMETLLRYLVVEQAVKNIDGVFSWYGNWRNHNYYWIDHGPGTPFSIVPWDLDLSFVHWTNLGAPAWNVRPSECTSSGGLSKAAPGCDKLINLVAATQWEKYVALGREFQRDHFQQRNLVAKITEWDFLIRDAIQQDPHVSYTDYRAATFNLVSRLIPELGVEFREHLQDSYRNEPDAPALNIPQLTYSGLDPKRINNFESANAIELQDWHELNANRATASLTHNKINPVYGGHDMALHYEFWPESAEINSQAYVEFILRFKDKQPIDLREYNQLWMMIHLPRLKTVRVDVLSNGYMEGADSDTRSKPLLGWTNRLPSRSTVSLQLYKMDCADEKCPDQKRKSGQVLAEVTGLRFRLYPEPDNGTLHPEGESGVMQIDNLFFGPLDYSLRDQY